MTSVNAERFMDWYTQGEFTETDPVLDTAAAAWDHQQAKIDELEAKLTQIQATVNEQAEDEGLWFNPKYVTEDYLQQALQRLHKGIEDE